MLVRTFFVALALWLVGVVDAPAARGGEDDEVLGTQEHPLEPPDTSSPRATLQTFLDDGVEGWRYFLENGTWRPAAARRGGRCLDLSKVPPAQREDVRFESSVMLFDVFNRIPLPTLREVPDADEMERGQRTRWVVPHTPIAIARVEEGPRAGEWLFTSETVRRAGSFYRATRQLPLKKGAVIEDGYRVGITASGSMIPVAWVRALPEWANELYVEQTLWQWGLAFVVLALAGLLAWLAVRWSRGARGPGEQPSARRALVGPVFLVLLSWATLHLIDEQVNLSGAVLNAFQVGLDAVRYLAAAWGVWLAGRLAAGVVATSARFRSEPFTAQLVGLVTRLASLAAVLGIVGVWASSLGIPVLAVITGLGVGGIAVALGAQSTVENFFGALMLFADRPVRVGDVCRFGDEVGTVEHIGLRSTRLRTPERSIVTIPNSEFSSLQLENLAQRDRRRIATILSLKQDTTREQLQRVLDRVRELLERHGALERDSARARFVAVGDDSLDVEIVAYVKTRDNEEFLAVQEELLMRILGEVEEAGTSLSTPERIVHLRSDGSGGG